MSDPLLRLYVSVPVACFRVAYAREYWETYPCPPPSTVYGMLLSLVGETDRRSHVGAELAMAMLSQPWRSAVLRTMWRIKDRNLGPGLGKNARPDFQELLTDVRLCVWIRQGRDEEGPPSGPLVDRLQEAFADHTAVSRFGGLSLGESTHLVDEIRPWRNGDSGQGRLLVRDERGSLTLPVWPDHVSAKETRWSRFRLEPEDDLPSRPIDEAWIPMVPP